MKNALKFTPTGMIKISADYAHSKMTISVTDTGCGIAKEEIPSVWTRFGKQKRTAELNCHGLGLGLKIVKQITELYHGEVSVHSDGPGQGSIFKVKLRLKPEQNETESSSFNFVRKQLALSDHSFNLSNR